MIDVVTHYPNQPDWEKQKPKHVPGTAEATYGPGIDQSQHAKSVSHIIIYHIGFFLTWKKGQYVTPCKWTFSTSHIRFCVRDSHFRTMIRNSSNTRCHCGKSRPVKNQSECAKYL